jgi:MoaA/NifB/PqqE/SkfB family radical SAM enzyme
MMNNFWQKDRIAQIHVELSNFCNAACPMCPRYFNGSEIVRPDLELTQITFELFESWFPKSIIEKVNQWVFCGTVGDPMMAKDVVIICEHIYSINPKTHITFNTNGGVRSEKDWTRLGELSRDHDRRLRIIFSIDGLEDTNHLYRRNVKWDVLMRNVKAYIAAGGNADWDFLIFKHNEHQIEEAQKISNELGFNNFAPKKALGFEVDGGLFKFAASDKKGEFQYWLEPPVKIENRNFNIEVDAKDRIININENAVKFYKNYILEPHHEVVNSYNGKTFKGRDIDFSSSNCKQIKCKSETWGDMREIFVNAEGHVSPCCYVGTQLGTTFTTPDVVQLQKKVVDYGKELFDLNKYSLIEILDNNHLNYLYANSWDKQDNERIMYCSNMCGEDSPIDKIWSHELNTRPNKDDWRKLQDKKDED